MLIKCRWAEYATRAAVVMVILASAPAAVFAASTGYDGVYRGDVTRTRGDDSICGKPSYKTTFSVVNGQFSIVYDLSHHVGVNLVVQPDGTFSGNQLYKTVQQQSQVKASGRISGNVLDAQIEGLACARSYHLTKG